MNPLTWLRIFTGPTLYRRYKSHDAPERVYSANFLESKADQALWAATALRTFCLYLSPFLASYLYSRGYLTSPHSLAKMAFYIGSFYGITLFARGLGRLANPDYTAFLRVLAAANAHPNPATVRALREFDSEFWAWPVNYNFSTAFASGSPRFVVPESVPRAGMNALLWQGHGALCWFAAHTFAGWMMYPGHLRLYNVLLQEILTTKRQELVEKHGGERSKLRAQGGLEVDTIFVDRRNTAKHQNGNRLVITCEGNAGFYEIGCMETPLGRGYSVLGWNHPGFGGSTGTPWPRNEAAAVDVVLQYATHHLGFQPADITIFAWSIGGHTATWAAMNYPDVSGLVLDATFDDLLPLAIPRMPQSLAGLVHRTVREYWDLPVLKQLLKYQGPVLIIRRTKDEIIVKDDTTPHKMLTTNRSKQLLLGLLRFRYPTLMERQTATIHVTRLFNDPGKRLEILAEAGDVLELRRGLARVVGEVGERETLFPLEEAGAGLSEEAATRLVIFLAAHYLVDFESVHCNPLPGHFFNPPKHPWED